MKTKIKHLKLDRYIANVIILLVISTFTSSNLSCQVTRYIGNVDSNIPTVLKVLDDNIYIYSYNGNNRQGVIIKQDLNGNNIWQLDLADDFIVNDFAKLGTTLMLVGSDDLFNFNNKNSAYCKIEDLGLTASIVFMQYFNKTDRDNFTRIIPKPGSTTNFLIQHYFTSSGDNVAILEIDNSGSILTNVAYSTIDDDQFWTGLKSGQDGITLIGDFGNLFNACYTELDNNLNGDKAYIINGLRTFRDYIDRGPNRKILVGYNNVINGYIVETDSLGQVTWAKRIDQTRVISDIFFGGSIAVSGGFEDTYYMLGQEDYGGGYYRQVMIKFIYTNINGTITTNIDWAKYFDEGTQSVPGAYVDFVSNKFYYAGFQHINATSNFGQADIFEAIVNKNFESCFTTDLTYTLTDTTFTTSELTITNSTTTFPSPTSFSTGSSVSFMTLDTCVTGPCHVDSLFVGTGYDTNNDTTHPVLSQDGQWILKEEPQNNGPVTLDSPAFVIN
ncbi:MAG: hypothetical protein KJN84_13360, partial [Bacteroidia bacterium]|nr:hypothetical protein [Bacteroidia bacterium]